MTIEYQTASIVKELSERLHLTMIDNKMLYMRIKELESELYRAENYD